MCGLVRCFFLFVFSSPPDSHNFRPTVTGSSTGLGHSIVSHILRQGERVVATSRSLSSLLALQPSYPAAQLLILPLDVTKPDQVEEVFEHTKKEFGRLDVVVNNAGYGINGEFESTPDEPARRQMEVCFWGPVNVMREVSIFRSPLVCIARLIVLCDIDSCGRQSDSSEK